ncbi:Putative ribonuclease H protein At1g65750 [Linum grandiflorum]
MRHPWLPGQEPRCPTPRTGTIYSGPTLVSDLFTNGRWNLELLRNHFSPTSVALIRSIPLPLEPAPDCWIWHFSPNGIFSTSSAFRYAQRRPLASEETCASPLDSSLWHSVWSLSVLPKLRFFLWRLLLRILPTREGLIAHHVDVDPICPVCLDTEETIEHLFFACPLALRLGAIIGLDPLPGASTHPAVIWRFLMRSNPSLGPRTVLLWWRIWKSRNLVVFERRQLQPHVLHRQYLRQVSELPLLLAPSGRSLPSIPSALPATWGPPMAPRIKVNVDGAVLPMVGGAVGLVVRNAEGRLLVGVGRTYPGLFDPYVLELLAVRDACSWCVCQGFVQVDIEGDAELVLSKLSQRATRCVHGGAIIAEILNYFSASPQYRLQVVRRSANGAAHSVARYALKCLPGCVETDLTSRVDL